MGKNHGNRWFVFGTFFGFMLLHQADMLLIGPLTTPIMETFPIFVATRASTGIDDAGDPGIYSLLADYFAPAVRGRVYGLLQISAPLGYIVGMVLVTAFKDVIGW